MNARRENAKPANSEWPDPQLPSIEFGRFSLAYPSAKNKEPLRALHDVTLSVRPGEILTIVGPSGCGKTTLLRAVAGLLTEDDNVIVEGDLKVFGMSSPEAKGKRFFAFTFQNPVLLPWRNVRQNVALPLEIMSSKQSDNDHIIDEMLNMVGISDFASAMPSEISGGMQQRVNLARALVQEPQVLLMDEPFGSLDEITRERLNFELLRIHRLKGQTILFVTHSLSEAVMLADRVLILSKRPAAVREIIAIDLPRERTEATLLMPAYLELVRKVREVFAKEEASP
jgi:NitT/TauT family transport system ATP-binding protein